MVRAFKTGQVTARHRMGAAHVAELETAKAQTPVRGGGVGKRRVACIGLARKLFFLQMGRKWKGVWPRSRSNVQRLFFGNILIRCGGIDPFQDLVEMTADQLIAVTSGVAKASFILNDQPPVANIDKATIL